MLRKILLMVWWFAFTMTTCNKENTVTTTDPFGEWILTGIFLSDAKDTPCGWQVNDHKEINLKMEKDTKGAIMISGQSVVNSYGGKVESIVYNDADKKGKIKITNLNTTERAGPKELMQCEERYYQMLHTAEEYTIDENGNLLLGLLKKPNSNPRDGGTYLIYKKK
ncbi:MAG: META domain-containing protein [Saprospiraceae bacterium]|nr:META domain-containing protein [Saprospiraceae bacterium]